MEHKLRLATSEYEMMRQSLQAELENLVDKAAFLHYDAIASAMFALPLQFATDVGWTGEISEMDGTPQPTDEEMLRALQTPIAMGCILDDLCRLLGIEPPRIVRKAIEGGVA